MSHAELAQMPHVTVNPQLRVLNPPECCVSVRTYLLTHATSVLGISVNRKWWLFWIILSKSYYRAPLNRKLAVHFKIRLWLTEKEMIHSWVFWNSPHIRLGTYLQLCLLLMPGWLYKQIIRKNLGSKQIIITTFSCFVCCTSQAILYLYKTMLDMLGVGIEAFD